jgi:hypothetical protein
LALTGCDLNVFRISNLTAGGDEGTMQHVSALFVRQDNMRVVAYILCPQSIMAKRIGARLRLLAVRHIHTARDAPLPDKEFCRVSQVLSFF